MKLIITIIRIVTGVLFIFSGLVKAIDPKGLAYKMQEFFEAWSNSGFMPGLMKSLDAYALSFSIIMIALEVVVGIALLIGYKKKITVWVLLLLMLFFTFLTSYVLFTGKIRACGCFGDCIPLTPQQTFGKDIVLLIFAILLLIYIKHITPIAKPFLSGLYVSFATIAIISLQWYVLRNLPLVDCLPYKVGNNIIELRKMPPNAIPDKFDYVFNYKKNGTVQSFKAGETPDSTWEFVDRIQTLVEKGSNNIPVISDFSLTTESGNDSTEAILTIPKPYYLLYIKDVTDFAPNWKADADLIKRITSTGMPIYIVTAQLAKTKERYQSFKSLQGVYSSLVFLTCDATVLKTVARVNPTLYLMNGPVVQQKWSYTSFDHLPE